MSTIGLMRQFKTKNFTVKATAEEELDLDLSFDETGEVREKLDNGDYIAFCAAVKVYYKGEEIGSDYLGNCIYESIDAFQDHREVGKQNKIYEARGERGRCGSYFKDMIHSAIAEARKTLKEKKKDYRKVYVRS